MNNQHKNKQRYLLNNASSLTSNYLHFRSPWIVLWWSAAFPGFGHYMVNSYLWGFILMSFEYFINTTSSLNTAIFLSMLGDFEQAKQIINTQWFLLYIVVYVFAIWDSYRRAIDLNGIYQLAYSESPQINPLVFSNVEINVLEKKTPWLVMCWSFLMPSIGYIYLHRVWSFLFSAVWWFIVVYFSNLLDGIHLTMLGQFDQAKAIIDPQWVLYLPSIYCFTMYNTYVMSVENNKLYEMCQARFLKEEYQQDLVLNGMYSK